MQIEKPYISLCKFQTETKMKKKTKSKTQLAIEYGIHYSTFKVWLDEISELNLNKNKRLLTPKQVELIYANFGIPEK